MLKLLTILIVIQAIYTFRSVSSQTFQWTNCGSSNAAIKIMDMTLTPLPALFDKPADLHVKAFSNRKVGDGPIRTELSIIRTVSGLSLPIKCFTVNGLGIGSCNYTDVCKDHLSAYYNYEQNTECYPSLAEFGIDCKCPLNIPKFEMDKTFSFNVPDFGLLGTALGGPGSNFTANGNFDISLKLSDSWGEVLCLKTKFVVKV